MNIFATDLDGTIITTKPENKNGIIVSVTPRGKSVISHTNNETLKEVLSLCCFIPVTTRGMLSYSTIDLGFTPKYALIDNGAILLRDGVVDTEWVEENRKIAAASKEAFTEAYNYLEKNGLQTKTNSEFVLDFTDIKRIKTEDEMKELTQTFTDITSEYFDICSGAHYIFATNKALSKGICVERLMRELKPTLLITAGDQKPDYSMFSIADFSIGYEDSPASFKIKKCGPEEFCTNVLYVAKKLLSAFDETVIPTKLKEALLQDSEIRWK